MPLIIDTYEVPALDISLAIYKNPNVHPVSFESLRRGEIRDDNKLYYIHKETDLDLRLVKYYFNEIVEVDTFIIQINKLRKSVRYLRYTNNMSLTNNKNLIDNGSLTNSKNLIDNGSLTNSKNLIDNGSLTNSKNLIDNGSLTNSKNLIDNGSLTSNGNIPNRGNLTNRRNLMIEEIKKGRFSTQFDKTSFLPHLKAQEDEIVIFPEDDEEE